MKPQFSSVPMEAYKLLSNSVAGNRVPAQWKREAIGHINDLRNLIKAGKHFELPPRQINYTEEDEKPGGLLEQTKQMCEKGVRLPYPVTTLSRVIDDEMVLGVFWILDRSLIDVSAKAVKLAEEAYGDGFFVTAMAPNTQGVLTPSGYILFVKYDDLRIGDIRDVTIPVSIVWEAPLKREYPHESNVAWHKAAAVVRDIIELNMGLNAEHMKVVVDNRLSGTRAKISKNAKHKSFYEIHRIVVDPNKVTTVSEYKGGTHASPRWHERRGYWRHMKKSGKVVWVQACEVGKKSNGMVYKDYEIKIGEK